MKELMILVIENYNANNFFWTRLIEIKSNLEKKLDEIVRLYKGFEGNILSYNCYVSNISNLNEKYEEIKNNYHANLSNLKLLLICECTNHESIMLFSADLNLRVMGFDVGFLKDEFNIYSSIFHEIIFGKQNDLNSYVNDLNQNLIFSSYDTALKYLELHRNLFKQKKDVENDEEMKIYQIFG